MYPNLSAPASNGTSKNMHTSGSLGHDPKEGSSGFKVEKYPLLEAPVPPDGLTQLKAVKSDYEVGTETLDPNGAYVVSNPTASDILYSVKPVIVDNLENEKSSLTTKPDKSVVILPSALQNQGAALFYCDEQNDEHQHPDMTTPLDAIVSEEADKIVYSNLGKCIGDGCEKTAYSRSRSQSRHKSERWAAREERASCRADEHNERKRLISLLGALKFNRALSDARSSFKGPEAPSEQSLQEAARQQAKLFEVQMWTSRVPAEKLRKMVADLES